jgi:Type I phosphodiesterase / nucleotide pyrophosphatase
MWGGVMVGRYLTTVFALAWTLTVAAPLGGQTAVAGADNVILVTLDGARTEEMFGGLDAAVLASTLKDDQKIEASPTYKRFWASTREERRRKLMPFLWQLLETEGSIAGDRTAGSSVQLRNRLWFSYPGYAEILLGEPHDAEITSNDPIRNPFTTVLERVREALRLPREKVATVASWSVFNAIAEHVEGGTFINAGPEPYGGSDPAVRLIDDLQVQAKPSWDGIRHDVFTFRLAMHHLATARPRMLYIAFDETDDWAHDGRYDLVLDAYARTDDYLRQLWAWVQSQPDYRGRTHLLITTDHGRGRTPADWRNHGAKAEGSGDVWIALASPRLSRRGVWRDAPALSTSQIAATLAGWMGVDWNAGRPGAGRPIQ